MVCTAAPILTTQPPTTCDIVSDWSWREWEKIGASAQTLQWIREGVSIPFKNNRPPSLLNQGVSLHEATHAQLEFVNRELARFVQVGAWEPSTCGDYVSILFLVPKPGVKHWRLICDR
jgi:hypothetical protein